MLPAGDDTCASPNASIVVNFRHAGALPGDRLGIWYGKNDQIAIDPILRIEDRSRMRLRQVIPRLGILVFENLSAEPRSYFTASYETVRDWRSAQAAFGRLSDLRSVAYGEQGFPGCLTGEGVTARLARTTIEAIDTNAVRLRADVTAPGILVLTDTFAPGWTASVNGAPAAVLRINGSFRGVCLPAAGNYQVTMTYRPPWWHLSISLAGEGLVGWSLLLLAWAFGKRRRAAADIA